MDRERSRYGLIVAALGAVVLAVSVFLPWYAVAPHTHAAASATSAGPGASVAHHHAGALSAQQSLEYLSVVLLVLACLALLDALLPLLRPGALPDGAGASLALLGAVATTAVAYHVVDRPSPAGSIGAPALREGVWLALLGSLLMLAGGLWPRVAPRRPLDAALSGLRGPTPQS